MKRILLATCLFIGATTMSFSQDGGGGGPLTPEERTNRYTASLKLTDGQSVKLKAIFVENDEKQKDITKELNSDPIVRAKALRQLREATQEKMQALLTKEQKTTYKELLKEAVTRRKKEAEESTPPPPAK